MLNLRLNHNVITTWVNWLITLTNSTSNSKVEVDRVLSYVAFTCWQIWKTICNFLFQKQSINPRHVIVAIDNTARTFHEASRVSVLTSSQANLVAQVPARWVPPPPLFVKLNVDASWDKATKSCFSGVVARDSSGTFIATRRSSFVAQSEAAAEAVAIRHGYEIEAAIGFNFVVIEFDSHNSISCLKGKISNGRWEAFPVLTKCKLLGDSFQDCLWSWTPRLANMAADILVSQRNREMCDFTWVDRHPSSLVHVLCSDGLPCPP
ncbi:hypothetical protein ACFX11_014776 [Malus domestica]